MSYIASYKSPTTAFADQARTITVRPNQMAEYLDFIRLTLTGMPSVAGFLLSRPLTLALDQDTDLNDFEENLADLYRLWLACRSDWAAIFPAGEMGISPAEKSLLAIIAALRSGDVCSAQDIGLQILHPHGLLDFLDVLQQVIDKIHHASQANLNDANLTLSRLDLLSVLRRGVSGFPGKGVYPFPGTTTDNRDFCRHLYNFLEILRQATTTPLNFAPVNAHRPTGDEQALLNCLACLQQGRATDGFSWLEGWMPQAMLHIAHDPLCRLALALEEAGLHLKEVAPA